MKRIWTIIGVEKVADSFNWYQSLLGTPTAAPAHDYWAQIRDADGTVLLCLHEWGAHDHPSLMSSDTAQPGNGLLLFFRVDDFDLALARARTRHATRRRASCKSGHRDQRVRASGSGRLLRDGQRTDVETAALGSWSLPSRARSTML